jgi:hypothetical protein
LFPQDVQKEKEAAEAGEEKRPLLAKTQSLCCIDYPRVVEILQLRIHMMRKKLKVAQAPPPTIWALPVAVDCDGDVLATPMG